MEGTMATKQTAKQYGIGSEQPRGFARLTPEERHRMAQIGVASGRHGNARLTRTAG